MSRHSPLAVLYPRAGNLLIALALLWLVWPLVGHTSQNAVVLGRYSLAYFALLSAWALVLVAVIAIAVLASRRMNLVLFWTLVASAGAVEAVARFRGWGGYYASAADDLRHPVPYVGFVGRPGAEIAGPPRMGGTDADQIIRFNALGFRGEVPGAKRAGVFRVIVLGGSTVVNGAPLDNSIPGLLQRHYVERAVTAEVFNWGVTSAVSGQELAILVHLASRFAPDLVIAYDGANDVFSPFSYDPRAGVPYDWMVVETGLSLLRDPASIRRWPAVIALRSRALSTLARGSLMSRLLPLDQLRRTSAYQTPAWTAAIVDQWANNVTAMCRVSRGLNARFAAFLQPTVVTKQPQVGGEPLMVETRELQAHASQTYDLMKARLQTLGPSLPDACSVADVSDVLDEVGEQLFWDYVHVTNDGNRRIAAAMFDHLIRDGHLAVMPASSPDTASRQPASPQ